MVDYAQSSQLKQWLFKSSEELEICRSKANFNAREFLNERNSKKTKADPEGASGSSDQPQTGGEGGSSSAARPSVEHFACGFNERLEKGTEERRNLSSTGPQQTKKGHPYLTPQEETTLVDFYASKLPSLIGPAAQVASLRRKSKVTATATMLLRRFFLSNSVMLHDPKAIMVAAAFLAAKVEDATANVRQLEQGTKLMNAPVTTAEIIPAENALIDGTHFDLLCFHPHKALVALTEDLKTFLKSEKGQSLVVTADGTSTTTLRDRDLKPLYDVARLMIDQAIVSDIMLLFSPGQVALAALMFAQERIIQDKNNNNVSSASALNSTPKIDWMGYLHSRFKGESLHSQSVQEWMGPTLQQLKVMLADLDARNKNESDNLQQLKALNKKLKKVRLWGSSSSSSSKNKKKRAASSGGDKDTMGNRSKGVKTE